MLNYAQEIAVLFPRMRQDELEVTIMNGHITETLRRAFGLNQILLLFTT